MTKDQAALWVSLFENGLDLLLLASSGVYIFALNDTSMSLSSETMTWIAGSGATARLFGRKIIKTIVEIKLSKGSK